MTIMLATLALNEMEWLPKLWAQHKDWPELEAWVFVEAADIVYANTNPEMIRNFNSPSVDGTSEYLEGLAAQDPRVIYIRHGISTHRVTAQGKVAARQRYMDMAETIKPDFVYVLDADEFYTHKAQADITRLMTNEDKSFHSFMFLQRHIWHPERATGPLFENEVVGGYWKIPHLRGWRWEPGLRYEANHNWLQDPNGGMRNRKVCRFNRIKGMPECIHMGYASSHTSRAAKHAYYKARGEGIYDRRQMYVDCRQAYEDWAPGQSLPHGASIHPYLGDVPECFQ